MQMTEKKIDNRLSSRPTPKTIPTSPKARLTLHTPIHAHALRPILTIPSRTQRIRAGLFSIIRIRLGLRIRASLLAPAQRAARMLPLIRLRRVQQRVLVFLLVPAVFSLLGVAVRWLDVGAPCVILGGGGGGVAGDVVRVGRFGFVGEGAFFEEFVQVVG